MKASEALPQAADVIEKGFCKDAYAKNEVGRRVDVMSPDAKCFCLLGAVARALGGSVRAADAIVDRYVQPIVPKRYLPIGEWGSPIPRQPREQAVSARAWNDDNGTSAYAVAHLLRQAGKAAAEGGD